MANGDEGQITFRLILATASKRIHILMSLPIVLPQTFDDIT